MIGKASQLPINNGVISKLDLIVETTGQKRDFNKSESTECLKDSDQNTGPKVEGKCLLCGLTYGLTHDYFRKRWATTSEY